MLPSLLLLDEGDAPPAPSPSLPLTELEDRLDAPPEPAAARSCELAAARCVRLALLPMAEAASSQQRRQAPPGRRRC